MSPLRLILASLWYHRRMNLAVGCGVAAGTAVLTGALLVGDSLRGSLRRLTLDRLGRIHEVLLTERFFRAELAGELAARPEFQRQYADAVPVILLRTGLHRQTDSQQIGRASRVNLVGCDERFWQLWPPGPGRPERLPQSRQIVLNEPLAQRLGVQVGGELQAAAVGDRVMLHLPQIGTIPADSLLGRKSETVQRRPLEVIGIIPAEGPGRFSLRANQQAAGNAYVSLATLQGVLGRPHGVNAVLVAGKAAEVRPPRSGRQSLQEMLRPTPEDYGIRIEKTDRGQFSYFNVTSDRIILPEAVEAELLRALAAEEVQPVLTYLANKIDTRPTDPDVDPAKDTSGFAYCTIAAVDFAARPPLGPLISLDGKPLPPLSDSGDGRRKIVLNQWAYDNLGAPDLGARPGETIYVSFFEPESTHGRSVQRTERFELAGVVRLTGAAEDRHLTPAIPNVTEAGSLADWKPPFQPFYQGRLRLRNKDGSLGPDEVYWNKHKATPKAFVSLSVGQELWGSRFGKTTSIRVRPRQGMTVAGLQERLLQRPEGLDPAAMGFAFQPVRRQGLEASVGTMSGLMSFSGLFVAFSFFVIAAAVMLVALLFRLGIDQRARQLGIFAAVGLSRRRVAGLLAGEGLLVAAAGSLIGVPAGVGYAALMLLGLRTWWLAAVVTPFLRIHVTTASLLIGFASGVAVALLAILWAVWRSGRVPVGRLLAGRTTDFSPLAEARPRLAGKAACLLMIAAMALGLSSMALREQARAGAFFGAGAMVLVASLMIVWRRLRRGAARPAVAVGRGSLARLAVLGAARNSGRSTLTMGLIAAACFLIVSVSAFHLDPTQRPPDVDGGDGGFALAAESDQPIYHDFNTPEGRRELGFSDDQNGSLAGTRSVLLRVKPGDDASCLNLYRPLQPRLLGLPEEFISRGGFAWAGHASMPDRAENNPWRLLDDELGTDQGVPLVPVVIDKNTATYSLHLWKGIGQTYDVTNGRGETIRLKVVGLLAGSIFQGDLLIAEKALLVHFPEVSGYRFFLTEAAPDPRQITPDRAKSVGRTLEAALGDHGLAAETTGQRLAGFLAVQNTYLQTFQSLGGLGLLLGTFGLAAVQLRNVLERRGELALMRAAGFRRSTLAAVVIMENGLLLLGGLAAGLLAALVAVLPHLLTRAASIPWLYLAATLALVSAVGLIAGGIAVRATLTAPLYAALRGE